VNDLIKPLSSAAHTDPPKDVFNPTISAVTAANLATPICAEHEAARTSVRQAVAHAIRAGELLLQAKAQLEHGAFGPWLAANVGFSERTARGYMRLAGLDESKRQRVADLSLREALASLAQRPDPKSDPADEYSRWFPAPHHFGLPLRVLERGGSFGGLLPDGRPIAVYESARNAGYWFVDVVDVEGGFIEGMKKPIKASCIGLMLEHYAVQSDMVWYRLESDAKINVPFWDVPRPKAWVRVLDELTSDNDDIGKKAAR
jgi:hypothetical protein